MKKRHARKRKKKTGLLHGASLIVLSVGFITAGGMFLWMSTIQIPDFSSFSERRVIESTKIYDRTGEVLLYDIHRDKKRTLVPFDDISRLAKNATIAIEDPEFYQHIGVKPKAFLRALFANINSRSFGQGGSTITQQVVKNTLLTPEKKISRKIKEWILAIKLERMLSKEDILTLYFNETAYGGTIYGIEQASLAFFGKSARDLTLVEGAYLAAIPQAPTFYSPYGNNVEKLEARKNLVLGRMLDNDFITEKTYKEALAEEVAFLPQDPFGIKAPHFVIWVREQLVEKYGEKTIQEGGLKIITTIDYELQQKAEEIVKSFAEGNEEKFNAKNAGMIGINPKTGEVLLMVGSRDYFETENEGNFNTTLASNRQPGSAFKPFVYATAFMQGYTPETVVFDLETQFSTLCDAEGEPINSEIDPDVCYTPKNYDNIYRGPVTLRNALAQSINIPAIKTLYLSGLQNAFNTAKKMGITGLTNPNQYGLTLVLGGGEVSLLDITSAYGVFANKGIRNPYVNILRIEDNKGNVLEELNLQPARVIPEKIANQISDILSDNVARTPAFGSRSPLYFEGYSVAAKTGTTNDYRDAWTVGYSPTFALGAWAGNNDNSSMEKRVAGFIITPMWNAVMQEALKTVPNEQFPSIVKEDGFELKPVLRGFWQGNLQYFVDSISQKQATEYTPEELKEERVLTQLHSILFWVNKRDPRGPFPLQPELDSQFELWEIPVQKWGEERGVIDQTLETLPKDFDTIHTPEKSPQTTILTPQNNQVFRQEDKIIVLTTTRGTYPLSRAEFYVNNKLLGTSKIQPFSFSFIPSEVGALDPVNELKVIIYDTVLNKSITSRLFQVLP